MGWIEPALQVREAPCLEGKENSGLKARSIERAFSPFDRLGMTGPGALPQILSFVASFFSLRGVKRGTFSF